MTPPTPLLVAVLLAAALPSEGVSETLRWMPPFGNAEHLRTLCTDHNHQLVVKGREPGFLHGLFRHDILCWGEHQQRHKYSGLVWLMKALGFCDINRVVSWRQRGVEFHRNFQRDILRSAFALVCRRTDDIGRFRLGRHAAVFRIMFEQHNEDRNHICERVIAVYMDLYNRCHVAQSPGRLRLIDKICSGRSAVHLIKMRAFFRRFSRPCDSFDDFFRGNELAERHLGRALANDTVFMNMLSSNLITAVSSDSQLPHLVLKTRLLLQHFSLAAIKLKRQIDGAVKCELRNDAELLLYGDGDEEDAANLTASENAPFGDSAEERCTHAESVLYDLPDAAAYRLMGEQALLGVRVELLLLTVVVGNTAFLSILLVQTRGHLSTATVLFVFNILFSNALFIASFACLFSDLLDDAPYGSLSEEHVSGSTAPALVVAETLQTHLFAETEFLKHLAQETLFSLSQNGSLLGLIHLLVLVLVVINRSMSGKAIRLSRRYVVSVFGLVWLFLIASHLIFSALQFSAISNLDALFSRLALGRRSIACSVEVASDYEEIGALCDSVAPFHRFGVYLLRGHTLFTLLFLPASMAIFTVTLAYHWKVRREHDFLTSGLREHSPHQRRETLFHTLLLSIGAFFVSVIGQTFVEIAVFWVSDRSDVADLARFYQMARIAAFADPVFNPVLVAVRTPALRRKMRCCICTAWSMATFLCWPWQRRGDTKGHKRKKAARRASSTTATADTGSSARPNGSDSEVTLKMLCTRQVTRSSLFRRSCDSATYNSVV